MTKKIQIVRLGALDIILDILDSEGVNPNNSSIELIAGALSKGNEIFISENGIVSSTVDINEEYMLDAEYVQVKLSADNLSISSTCFTKDDLNIIKSALEIDFEYNEEFVKEGMYYVGKGFEKDNVLLSATFPGGIEGKYDISFDLFKYIYHDNKLIPQDTCEVVDEQMMYYDESDEEDWTQAIPDKFEEELKGMGYINRPSCKTYYYVDNITTKQLRTIVRNRPYITDCNIINILNNSEILIYSPLSKSFTTVLSTPERINKSICATTLFKKEYPKLVVSKSLEHNKDNTRVVLGEFNDKLVMCTRDVKRIEDLNTYNVKTVCLKNKESFVDYAPPVEMTLEEIKQKLNIENLVIINK